MSAASERDNNKNRAITIENQFSFQSLHWVCHCFSHMYFTKFYNFYNIVYQVSFCPLSVAATIPGIAVNFQKSVGHSSTDWKATGFSILGAATLKCAGCARNRGSGDMFTLFALDT